MGVIPPWSDLPQELLSAIAECLNSNPIDILSFRCVCKSWCSSIILLSTLFPPLPLTTPNPPYCIRHRCGNNPSFTLLSTTAIYALRDPAKENVFSSMPKAWVLFLDQSIPGNVSIRKPFSKGSYSLPLNFPTKLDMLGFRASELGRFYNLSNHPSIDGKLNKACDWFGCVLKVVLFSSCDGFFVFALSEEGKLGLLRLGLEFNNNNEGLSENMKWEIVHDGKRFRFDDIVDFKGRVLAIDRRGRVYVIGIGDSSSVGMSVIVPPIAGGGGRRKRLVESLGRLYLVVRCNGREETDALFKVYVLNESSRKWVEVKSLGDRTFFLGLEFSFSAPAEELHGSYGKNCILFVERSFLKYTGYDDDSNMFRKLETRALNVGVWHLEDAAQLAVIGSLPGYTNVLWPPPTWIWPITKSERVEALLTVLEGLQITIPEYKKFKTKLEELTPAQQKNALTFMKSAVKMKETLKQAIEIKNMLKQIEMVAESWQQQCKSKNLHNQEGTATLETEGGHLSIDSFRILSKAMKEGNSNFDVLSMEMELHTFIHHLEEDTAEVEKFLSSQNISALILG